MSDGKTPGDIEYTSVVYLKPNANWKQDGARFAAYFYREGMQWVDMTDEDGDETHHQASFINTSSGGTTTDFSTFGRRRGAKGVAISQNLEDEWVVSGDVWDPRTAESFSADMDTFTKDLYINNSGDIGELMKAFTAGGKAQDLNLESDNAEYV
jgi:hypothetical protein